MGAGIGLLTFGVMCACTIWGRGQVKLYPALIGILVGWGLCFSAGLIPQSALAEIAQAPWFALPSSPVSGYAFEASMLIPFLVASMASGLKGVGDLTLCQKVNDADWKRTDMRSVSQGATASGLTTVLCGLIGTLGHSTSSSNVGLSVASGATSRVIGFSMGALMILFAFLPKLSLLIASLPAPLMGATLLYAACFMILAGIQMLASRLLDARRILMAGVSMSLGLSVVMMPELYRDIPAVFKPLVASPVSFGAVLAMTLNVLFLIGSKRRTVFELLPGEDHYLRIRDELMKFGASVAARKEVIMAAIVALGHASEALEAGFAKGPVKVTLAFDEFNLDLDLAYEGRKLLVPDERPDRASLLKDPDALSSMSAWLMAKQVLRVRSHEERGAFHLSLRLEH
jgi:NCS2 family nucleobase:cation symporter-2